MALANTAGLLAKWGKRLLIIDWDLEAPGIEKYFEPWLTNSRKNTPGLIELINTFADQKTIDWRDCLLHVRIPQGENLAILHAGRDSDHYTEQLRKIDWESLFQNQKFGLFLEQLRTDWISEYDYIFIDSRTGFTDIGGICTIHLPDVLIGLFTSSAQSLHGLKGVFKKARLAHSQLPVDRHRLMIVPIPARDESATEYELSGQWRRKFASELAEFYSGWLPKDETVERILDHLKIPYFAYWSFGERLPVLEEDPNNPKTLAFSYQLIARLLLGNLDWEEVKRGTRAVEAEATQKLAIKELTFKAAKVREEAQREAAEREKSARQAELASLRLRFKKFLETMFEPALNRHRRRALWWLVAAWACGFIIFSLVISLLAFIEPLSNEDKYVIYGNLAFYSAGLFFSVRAWRRNKRIIGYLENELVQYDAGVGKYQRLSPATALTEFVNSVQTLIILKGVEGKPDTPDVLSSKPTIQQPQKIELPLCSPKANVPIDVFLSYEHSAFTSGWLREFLPLFTSWLKEGIGTEPIVFDPERLLDFQEIPPKTLQALNKTRCFIPILTPSYFRSEFCLSELRKIKELNKAIVPILLHPIDQANWPVEFEDLKKMQMADFSDFAFIGEAFTKSDRYIDFQKALKKFSEEVAKVINNAAISPEQISPDESIEERSGETKSTAYRSPTR